MRFADRNKRHKCGICTPVREVRVCRTFVLFCFLFVFPPFFIDFSGGTTGEIPSLVRFLTHERSSACLSFYNKKNIPSQCGFENDSFGDSGLCLCLSLLVFNDIYVVGNRGSGGWLHGHVVMGSGYVFMGQCWTWCCSLVSAA